MNEQKNIRPIGEHFTYNGVKLVVVENTMGIKGYCGPDDDRCYFDQNRCDESENCRGECCACNRYDFKDVYFKEV